MTAATPRPRREGWPWPAAPQPTPPDDDVLLDSQALVHAMALEVAQATEHLRLALDRLEQAQVEARVVGEFVAAREAVQAIARAQRTA